MIKKVLILSAVLAVALAAAANVLSRRAPEFIRVSLEKSLNKKVNIHTVGYRFPGTFELEGFAIQEPRQPFAGEVSFFADRITLYVSPMSLSRRALILDKVEVDNAQIAIRKLHGKLSHALSDAAKKAADTAAAPPSDGARAAENAGLPLEIHFFKVTDSRFKFIDYDAQEGGFVFVLDGINAEVKNISMPFSAKNTSYEISARVLQGRDQRPAEFRIAGWTAFLTKDTDANVVLTGLDIPYFYPYYAKITPAAITAGYLNARMNVNIRQNELVINADCEALGLLFQTYEGGDQLFGLKAEEILAFLKDSAGRLKFQIVVRWNLADRSVRLKDVIRQSIERSLKNTILGNVGNILSHTIQRLGEKGTDQTKDELEDQLKKIKDLLKF